MRRRTSGETSNAGLARHAAFRDVIRPIDPGTTRPLWSVMIPTYNCADYLRQTLESVLAQDPGPDLMQIEVIDDHSTSDDPEHVVREVAGNRVLFHRQPSNVGHVRNFNTCIQRARGHLIHLLHGDDMVMDGFYRAMALAFQQEPAIGAAFCRSVSIDEDGVELWTSELQSHRSGILSDWFARIAVQQRLLTPSIVVRRGVYEHLNGFDSRIQCYGEDWEMWVRIAAHYPVWYELEPLARYRIHASSLTGRHTPTGAVTDDLKVVLNIIDSYTHDRLTPVERRCIHRGGARSVAFTALHVAADMLDNQQWSSALRQMWEAARYSRTRDVLYLLACLLARAGVHRARWMLRSGTA